ncbi:beta-ketoacyl synthase N-terminal-like domain-containing protein, partial [Streptomyces sp. NPDC052051]|uniref:beta-ketoacyl synthase N-terminal-like domain-containing protein n=1 Tax=Streptomyces sp. NPDC052051 TaxID=3154649 RepID=UPI00342702C7
MSRPEHIVEPIAVVGLACRFPGGSGLRGFTELLLNGASGVGPLPRSEAFRDGVAGTAGVAGFVEDVAGFDLDFFDMTRAEARNLDPRQRWVLEVAWESLEDAGIVPDRLSEEIRAGAGVFVGAMGDDYADLVRQEREGDSAYGLTGLSRGVIANRLSYVLGWQGPSWVVDSGQSSGLVAVWQAVQALRRGECALAVAGAVNLLLNPAGTRDLEALGALSPTGACHTFDADADGYVRGEGVGMVVLKRLDEALAAGDTVRAVITGGAVNNDGGGTTLSTPTSSAQAAVIRRALADAGLTPEQIQYAELHGTGTRAGDPVEAAGLAEVFTATRSAEEPLLVGSVKTNIGHLEAAAGIAGFIKTVVALETGRVPATLNHRTPHPDLLLDERRLSVPTRTREWPRTEGPRRAGVSAFGIGGTNAHLILEQAPTPTGAAASAGIESDAASTSPENKASAPVAGGVVVEPRPVSWVVSARTEPAMREQAGRVAAWVRDNPGLSPEHIATTLETTRTLFDHRAITTGTTREELLTGLDAITH